MHLRNRHESSIALYLHLVRSKILFVREYKEYYNLLYIFLTLPGKKIGAHAIIENFIAFKISQFIECM